MRHRSIISTITAALLTSAVGTATAEPLLRVQVTQRGDFVLIGNTLGQDCAAGVPAPIVGNVGACGPNTNDTSPDVFWQSDSAMGGQATASNMVSVANARSTAVLNVPAGATVSHAYLYWSARSAGAMADPAVTLEGPNGFSGVVMAADSVTTAFGGTYYQSAADITSIVQAQGLGAYSVSGVDSVALASLNDPLISAGWWMVVLYELPGDSLRTIAIHDGLDQIIDGAPAMATIGGFTVPMGLYNAKIGLIAYDGDDGSTGDDFLWNTNPITDALNPAGNIFNGTRSHLGMPVSNVGDLPQLTGGARSMSGIDLDVLDITSSVMPGQTSADIMATTIADTYVLGGIITSISTRSPDLTTSSKTVIDVNGGNLQPGDELQYVIDVRNTGDDAAIDTVLVDNLPPQVTYVPGTIEVVAGPNMGAKTDMSGDDQGEFDMANNRITVRLGTGADATNGGTLDMGTTSTVRFTVKVNPNSLGLIENQAMITAAGQQGTPSTGYMTDGNGMGPGAPPTSIIVDSDGDGLADGEELAGGTDPTDADSDDDGVRDGDEPLWNIDSDGDGIINALDADSDNDGLFDGTELGNDCSNPATNTSAGNCVPDADNGVTTTNPLDADTDNGGVSDGSEDANLNGQIDPGELDPNNMADDMAVIDSDGDGLSDALEATLGSDPMDADTDDDGALDGAEPNPGLDSDGDGVANIFDVDSDNDGLFDGTEMGFDCSNPATNAANGTCIADADMGLTVTGPLDRDTDNGGVPDGAEDFNHNGMLDKGELEPTIEADDSTSPDMDGDGLPDAYEVIIGSNPNDADSDDDGVPDGFEPNPTVDTDGDGKINLLDPDSDGDGLLDGTELGYDCNGAGTDKAICIPDADPSTHTSPLLADTDGGGVVDGGEDTNANGQVDAGETNPLDGTDDDPCKADSDCGDSMSGRVCGPLGGCIDGCRGTDGNGCPSDKDCTSTDSTIGMCVDPSMSSSSSSSSSSGQGGAGGEGGAGGAGGANTANPIISGGGCDCSTTNSANEMGGFAALGLALAVLRRRRRS